MNWSQIWWIPYSLVVLTRVLALRMRLRVPALREADTFFGIKVTPDFYSGPGRQLMRAYRIGLILPSLLEAILLAPVFYWGRLGWIMAAVVMTSLMLFFWWRWNVRRIFLMAKPYAVVADHPVATVSLHFETRRLTSYRNLPMEVLIWAFDISALFLIGDAVRLTLGFQNAAVHSFANMLLHLSGFVQTDAAVTPSGAWLFWPLVLVYIQLGAALMKYAALAWPMRMSTDTSEEVRNYRENVRRHLIRSCDWFRLVFSLVLLTTAIDLRFPDLTKDGRWEWLGYSLGFAVVIAILVWYQINAKRLFQQAHQLKSCRAIPRSPAAPDPSRFRLGGLAYYDPDSPSVLIPSRAGYALNFADRRAYISLAYVIGLAILAFVHLRFGWG